MQRRARSRSACTSAAAGDQAAGRVGEHRSAGERRRAGAARAPPGCARPPALARARRGRAAAAPRTSGTTRLAASVGVDARTSATRSSSGVSRLVADRADDRRAARGDRAHQLPRRRTAAGPRREPPPRATTMTSTSRSASSARIASTTCGDRVRRPGRRRSRTRNAHRRPAAAARSRRRRARPRTPRPQTRPTTGGRNGSGRLRSAAKSPSAASSRLELLEPGQQLADADRAGSRRRRATASRGRGSHAGLACTTTRAPSVSGGATSVEHGARAGHAAATCRPRGRAG